MPSISRAAPIHFQPHNAHDEFWVTLLEKGDLDAAIAECGAAIRLQRGNAATHCILGNALRKKHDVESVVAEYHRTAIRLRPDLADAHHNLGVLLGAKGVARNHQQRDKKREADMLHQIKRREFLQLSLAGTALGLGASNLGAVGADSRGSRLISPGCRRTRVKVARIYLGGPGGGVWGKPNLDLQEEIRSYQAEFDTMKDQFSDVDFVVDQLVSFPRQVEEIKDRLRSADGILAIHVNADLRPLLTEILRVGRPTMVFAIPYSGHGWVELGAMRKQEAGAKMECMLTSDRKQLAVAIRPFRAIHHLREAKILDLATRSKHAQYASAVRSKFGAEIKQIDLQQVRDAYEGVSESEAKAEADRWIQGAVEVVEPTKEEIIKSCRLALAFGKLLEKEDATVMTVDCYGSMWDRTIKTPAYPCLGFSYLNNMGLGGICESDLPCAMTYILFQGLAGKPGFVSDPTMDESENAIILAHCMGTPKMAGPDKPAAPYELRTVAEREEGVVAQVKMNVGQKVTQANLVGADLLVYFTGEIIDVPYTDRGCRTKITVKLDGDAEKLWENWGSWQAPVGHEELSEDWAPMLHRVTCYGDLTKDLEHFCRFEGIRMINEAV
jgi:hypothetical protein